LEQKEIKEPTRSIHKSTISIGGKMGAMICAWADHLCNIDASYQGQKAVRKFRTIPTQTVEAKSRGGMVPDSLAWLESDKETFGKLRGFFK
jgi:hypothetical protein